jgi:hypothetical protein
MSLPPYVIEYEWPGHTEIWSAWHLRQAIELFWQDNHLSHPARREVTDSTGASILAESGCLRTVYSFTTTREAWAVTVALSEDELLAERLLTKLEDASVSRSTT